MTTLTPPQRRAVETVSDETLVIAGAGSGKTRVLIERIVHLVETRGASLSDMMVLTFTRKAAGEMKERLVAALGGDEQARHAVGVMMIGTFHSLALDILRQHGERLGYDPEKLTIVESNVRSTGDADLLLKQVCEDLGYRNGKKWKLGLSWTMVSSYREEFFSLGLAPGNEKYAKHSGTLWLIMSAYRKALREYNALDYGSILLECSRLLEECPEVLDLYLERIRYVIVDELQDANAIQHYGFLDLFAPAGGERAEFFGVGDPRQTIYGFRGARPDLMTSQHPDAELINLDECFRCGDSIVAAANRLIAVNEEPNTEPMIGATRRAGVVTVKHGRSVDISHEVSTFLGFDGYAPSDIAILSRTHKPLRRLAGVFSEQDIPCHRVGSGFDICGTDEFRLIHAILRLCVNRRDELAFLRVSHGLGVSRSDYARCRAEAKLKRLGTVEVYSGQYPRYPHFDLTSLLDGDLCSGETLVGWLIDEIAEVDELGASLDVALVSKSLDFWQRPGAPIHLGDALRWYAMLSDSDDTSDDDTVTLSTIHAAKGLEWPVVILVGLNEGSLPSSRSLREEDGLRDEHRAGYVAMTRAREQLVLHWRSPEDQSDLGKKQPQSRFVAEAMGQPAPEDSP